MKYQLISSFLLTSSAAAFFVHPSQHRSRCGFRTSSSLRAERGDSKKAIEEALEASRTFGPQSKEARVAWDIVEEINASDNSIASKPGNPMAQVDRDTLSKIKHHVQMHPPTTKPIKLGAVSPQEWMDMNRGTSAITDPVLKKALSNAELMTEWWGIQSKEAKLAWEAVEDILSNDQSEVVKGPINPGEECLVDLMNACEAIEELDRVLFHKETMVEHPMERGFE